MTVITDDIEDVLQTYLQHRTWWHALPWMRETMELVSRARDTLQMRAIAIERNAQEIAALQSLADERVTTQKARIAVLEKALKEIGAYVIGSESIRETPPQVSRWINKNVENALRPTKLPGAVHVAGDQVWVTDDDGEDIGRYTGKAVEMLPLILGEATPATLYFYTEGNGAPRRRVSRATIAAMLEAHAGDKEYDAERFHGSDREEEEEVAG